MNIDYYSLFVQFPAFAVAYQEQESIRLARGPRVQSRHTVMRLILFSYHFFRQDESKETQ